MNKDTFELIKLLLEKEPPSKERTEIIKFYLLPRNTPIKPMIELPDEEQVNQLGTTQRPSERDLYDKDHPEEAEEKKAIKDTLKGRV